MLWRLLVVDDFVNQRPAPPATALFLPHLIAHMFSFYFDRGQFGLSGGPALNDDAVNEELDALQQIIEDICRLEPESMPFLPDMPAIREHLANFNVAEIHVDLLDTLLERATDIGFAKEVQDMVSLTHGGPVSAQELKDYSESLTTFFQREVFSKMSGRLFKESFFSMARTGKLGLGYSSIKAQDEVWLLNGHSAPVILRQLTNGNYRFLGETFVQGMMYGELAEELGAANFPVERIQIE